MQTPFLLLVGLLLFFFLYWFVCILSAHTTREKCEVPFLQGFASNSSHHLSHTYSRDLCGVGGPVGLHAPFGARTAKKANIESNIIKNNLQLHIKKEIFPPNCFKIQWSNQQHQGVVLDYHLTGSMMLHVEGNITTKTIELENMPTFTILLQTGKGIPHFGTERSPYAVLSAKDSQSLWGGAGCVTGGGLAIRWPSSENTLGGTAIAYQVENAHKSLQTSESEVTRRGAQTRLKCLLCRTT
ncbi:hypothetical protein FRACYDRAFT_245912 [Fragilariopsis cylindrus CCMP1102]|uniref:Uncharacterized protein n=1 Tax=Fragilariopsis cylindrus CCMP1102 TaxID=635003 RepID=A0A1E7EZW5_9STRA|nr:hypothetical protein FRACYDRAFT_245912 [Fragilariopsis cylindrus CCMP1102]|eukprot:OEU11406.1 hypothetical protein FRACYDRAFT_245912 [Fragilariopsis cylindrus CCMP1102]